MSGPLDEISSAAARALGTWTAKAHGGRAVARGLASIAAIVLLEAARARPPAPAAPPALRLIRGGKAD